MEGSTRVLSEDAQTPSSQTPTKKAKNEVKYLAQRGDEGSSNSGDGSSGGSSGRPLLHAMALAPSDEDWSACESAWSSTLAIERFVPPAAPVGASAAAQLLALLKHAFACTLRDARELVIVLDCTARPAPGVSVDDWYDLMRSLRAVPREWCVANLAPHLAAGARLEAEQEGRGTLLHLSAHDETRPPSRCAVYHRRALAALSVASAWAAAPAIVPQRCFAVWDDARAVAVTQTALARAAAAAEQIPVYILCHNNCYYVRRMVEQLLARGVAARDIVVVDSGSRAATLQDLDALQAARGIRTQRFALNLGPKLLRHPEFVASLPEAFAFTDPDLRFNPAMPRDFRSRLLAVATECGVDKAGLALGLEGAYDCAAVPDYCQGQGIAEWEERFWRERAPCRSVPDDVWRAEIDTTFAVYRTRTPHTPSAVRVAGRFTCMHLPWHPDENARVPAAALRDMYTDARWSSFGAKILRLGGGAEAPPPLQAPLRADDGQPAIIYALCTDAACERSARAAAADFAPWLVPLRLEPSLRTAALGVVAASRRAADDAWAARRWIGFVRVDAGVATPLDTVSGLVQLAERDWPNFRDVDVLSFGPPAPAAYAGHAANASALWVALSAAEPRLTEPFCALAPQWAARPSLLLDFAAWYEARAAPLLDASLAHADAEDAEGGAACDVLAAAHLQCVARARVRAGWCEGSSFCMSPAWVMT